MRKRERSVFLKADADGKSAENQRGKPDGNRIFAVLTRKRRLGYTFLKL